jgi:carbamoyl-phosphate synthase small subunit
MKGFLILEDKSGAHPDGIEFEGELFGALPDPKNRDQGYGEVVFNTSMTGYQEILTDPSYYGQMVCLTYPHIGNTGVNLEDPESRRPWCGGLIIHDLPTRHSNWRSQGSLSDYLKEHGVPGISGVDTRALTRHLRSLGVVRGLILQEKDRPRARQLLASLPEFEGRDLISEVSTTESYHWPLSSGTKSSHTTFGLMELPPPSGKKRVVAMDFGVKWNLLRSLERLGCQVEVVPARTSATAILERKPDGIFLSNGPGDPSAAPYAVETIGSLLGRVPMFGVCMGHQLLALALGAKTFKLKFGHRGANQPVLDRTTGRVEISSQNHGYAVDIATLKGEVEVTHVNLNDKTLEGISIPSLRAFSVQYHPEAAPGPHDSSGLFHRFIELMESNKK